MGLFQRVESSRLAENAIYEKEIPVGDGWMYEIKEGQILRITNVTGSQAADAVFYDAHNIDEHYSAAATMTAQRKALLGAGTILYSESGKGLLEIVADTFGAHDPFIGHCTSYNNSLFGGMEVLHRHSCHDTLLLQIAMSGDERFSKVDLAPNINFFLSFPFSSEGEFRRVKAKTSEPGDYVELKALRDVIIIMSNCPHLGVIGDLEMGRLQVTIWKS